jgi:hypothetical protein
MSEIDKMCFGETNMQLFQTVTYCTVEASTVAACADDTLQGEYLLLQFKPQNANNYNTFTIIL